MLKRIGWLLFILMIPVIAFAVGNASSGPAPDPIGIPSAWIILGLTVASAIVPLTKLIPGWGTISNIATGLVAAFVAAFTPMAQDHPTITIGAFCAAAIGAVLGYMRSEKRAGIE